MVRGVKARCGDGQRTSASRIRKLLLSCKRPRKMKPGILKKAETTRPARKLRSVIGFMLSSSDDQRQFIVQFFSKVFSVHRPANFMSILLDIVKQQPDVVTPIFINNLFSVLRCLSSNQDREDSAVSPDKDDEQESVAFDAVWLKFLSYPLSMVMRRRVLFMLPDQVMPHFHNALRLTDFLLSSYQLGGIHSMLALHGVFLLMHNHNLEFPDFYTKLYSLLHPNVLRTRHTARFFQLLDLFLRSSYLPLYLAAAFAKRLARVALLAPTPMQRALLVLVCNITVRHASLYSPLCADLRGTTSFPSGDPYDAAASDPSECRALESCLWEVASLQNHVVPAVCRCASFVGGGRVEKERATDEMFTNSYAQMIQQELSREVADVPRTFHRPQGLLMCAEDRLNELWHM